MRERQETEKDQASEGLLVMALITLSGGLQDAYSYIVRDGVFANAQTGNIVLLSQALFSCDAGRALSYLVPVAAFACGTFAAAEIRHRFKRGGNIHWRQIVVILEIILLAAVGFIPAGHSHIANALVSFSCAMQVEAFRKVKGLPYASTMCIGNLRSCMDSLSGYCHTKNRTDAVKARHYAAVIILFAAGAGAGSIIAETAGIGTIWISALLLAASFIVMLRR